MEESLINFNSLLFLFCIYNFPVLLFQFSESHPLHQQPRRLMNGSETYFAFEVGEILFLVFLLFFFLLLQSYHFPKILLLQLHVIEKFKEGCKTE